MNIIKRLDRILISVALTMPLLGPILGAIIEHKVLGLPVETRVPVLGACIWIACAGLGMALGVRHRRLANSRKWLGVIAVVLNLISILGLAVIYPSALMVNPNAMRARMELQAEANDQQTVGGDESPRGR